MHQSPTSKPPPSRFRRVTVVIQTVLVLALTGMIPTVSMMGIYLATNGAPFDEIQQYSCGVDHGRVVFPFTTENLPQNSGPRSPMGSCEAKLYQTLYHGQHEINCYASVTSNKPAGSPFEIAYLLAITICAGVMLLLCLPVSIQILHSAVVGEDLEKHSPWRNKSSRRILILLPTFGLFMPSFLSLLQDDIQSYLSKDWSVRECVLVEACNKEDPKMDRSGFVFELREVDKVFRSDSYTGYFSSFSVPDEIKGKTIGASVPCYQNPKFLAQLKIQPYHAPRWIDYLTRLILLILWIRLAGYAMNRLTNRR